MPKTNSILHSLLISIAILAWLFSLGCIVSNVQKNRLAIAGVWVSLSEPLIVRSFANGAQSYSGLEVGDHIIHVGKATPNNPAAFITEFLNTGGEFTVVRNGEQLNLTVHPIERPFGTLTAFVVFVVGLTGVLVAFFGTRNQGRSVFSEISKVTWQIDDDRCVMH
jgi:hypothetical protein